MDKAAIFLVLIIFAVFCTSSFVGEILMNAGLIPHGDTAGQLFGDLPAKTKGTLSWPIAFLKKGTCLFIVKAAQLKFFYILLHQKDVETALRCPFYIFVKPTKIMKCVTTLFAFLYTFMICATNFMELSQPKLYPPAYVAWRAGTTILFVLCS
jgi:hypothetical protein